MRSVSLPAEEVASGLEGGGIDLALGYFPDLKKHNFFQQTLFCRQFREPDAAGSPGHAAKLTLKQFLSSIMRSCAPRAAPRKSSSAILARKKIRGDVVLTTPHFASAPIDRRAIGS